LTAFRFVWFVIDLEVILYGQTTVSWDFSGSIDDYFNPERTLIDSIDHIVKT
jgi:hypothetical protein